MSVWITIDLESASYPCRRRGVIVFDTVFISACYTPSNEKLFTSDALRDISSVEYRMLKSYRMTAAKAITSNADYLVRFLSVCSFCSFRAHTSARQGQISRWWYPIVRLQGQPWRLESGIQLPCDLRVAGLSPFAPRVPSHPHIPLLPAPAIISPTKQLSTQRPICTLMVCFGIMRGVPIVWASSINSVC